MTRKTPCRHRVKGYTRSDGTKVKSYMRGTGRRTKKQGPNLSINNDFLKKVGNKKRNRVPEGYTLQSYANNKHAVARIIGDLEDKGYPQIVTQRSDDPDFKYMIITRGRPQKKYRGKSQKLDLT